MDDEPVVVTDLPSTEPKEPALSSGLTVAFSTLFVNGLVILGVPLDTNTKIYIVGAITFLAPLIAGAIIRSKVFSPKTVEQIEAYWKLVVADKDAQLVTVRAEVTAAKAVEPIERTLPRLFANLAPAPAPVAPPPVREPAPQPQMPQGLTPTDTRALPQVGGPAEPSEAYKAFMASQESVRIPTGDRTRPVAPPTRPPAYPREYEGYAPPPEPPEPVAPEGYQRRRHRLVRPGDTDD